MNVRNTFRLAGTVIDTPVAVDHPDGGRTIRFSLRTKNNYKLRDGQETYEELPVSVYRNADAVNDPKRGSGLAGTLQAGDKVAVQGSVRNNNWVDTQGHTHYELVLQVENVDLIGSAGTPAG